MALKKDPVFRKVVVPWHRSRTAYALVLAGLLLLFYFGLAGIDVTRENARYQGLVWVPVLMACLSGTLIVTTTLRLIRRLMSKKSRHPH
jgi:hypothetical protein